MSPTVTRKHEQDRPQNMVFLDFNKAFDAVGGTMLWHLLRKYGCAEKFATIIEALHTGIMKNVRVRGEVSESFNEVKQGCVLAPRSSPSSYQQRTTMFSGVSHFRAKTKTTRMLMREVVFADDSALDTHSVAEMLKNSGCFIRCVNDVRPED